MRGRIVIAAVLLLAGAQRPAAALDPEKRLTQFGHRAWTRQQGLPQDSVRVIAQAADGALWVGTDEGLARFDGTEFTRFRRGDAGLPTSSITALAPARDGSMWIGTLAGVSHYRDGVFHNFDRSNGLGTQSVSGLLETSDGTVWAVGGLVASAIRNGRVTNYGVTEGVPAEGLRELIQTRDGAFWAAGIGVVVRFDGSRFRVVAGDSSADASPDSSFSADSSAEFSMRGNIALAMTEGRDGTVWIAGTKGVAAVRPDGRSRVYAVKDGLSEELARAILEDRDGNVWVGTVSGLARVDGERLIGTPVTGLSPVIWDLFEDRDGSLWIGTNAGLHQLREQPIRVYGTAEGFPSDQPSAIYQEPDGTVWIGFRDAGVIRLSGGRFVRFTERDGLAANEVFGIRGSADGDVLVATRLGLTTIRGGRLTTTVPIDPLGRSMVYDAIKDERGHLWLATHGGVVFVENGRQTAVVPGGAILSAAIVALARAPDGTLWAGTYGEGLWQYQDRAARRLTERDGLSSNAIRSLLYDPGTNALWIGTAEGGLAWYHNGRFGNLTTKSGLESENVGQIIDDGNGALWLGTTVGLARIEKQGLLGGGHAPGGPHVFVESDGLRSSHCAPGFPVAGGGTRDREGQLWVATANGVALLRAQDAGPRGGAGETRVTAVLVDGQPARNLDSVTLSSGTRQLEFRYASTSLVFAERLRYRYRLEGLDGEWIDAGSRRSAEYRSVPPGRYRFVAEASLGGDVFGQPGVINITRRAAWHETVWFPYAAFVVILGAVGAIYWERARRIQARFEVVLAERNRISQELHDTLAQDFVGIASQLSGVAETLRGDPLVAERHLDLARRMTQYSLTEARRSIMDLRSSALEGRDLRSVIEGAAREMCADTEVNLEVTGPLNLRLSSAASQELLRIAREAVANALTHASPQRIEIGLERTDGRVGLTIRDDGVGFDPAHAFASDRGHFGLLGMRERAQRARGVLSIDSAPGRGTRVSVVVPVS